jgi:PAS domain S-box-containing protein
MDTANESNTSPLTDEFGEPVDSVFRSFNLRRVLPASLTWLLVAGLSAVAMLAQWLSMQGQSDAIYMPYAGAVLLVAVRFGERVGAAAALVSMLVFVVLVEVQNGNPTLANGWIGYVLGALTMAGIAWALGWGSRRLVESEERFRTSVENLLEPFGIYRAVRDEHGKIVDFVIEYLNPIGAKSNGLPRNQQIGRRLLELFPGRLESGLFDDYCQVVETGEPLMKDAISLQDLFGEKVVVRAFDIRVTKLGDGFAVAWRDITERKAAEQALRDIEHRMRAMTSSLPLTLFIQDSNLKFVWFAETKLGTPVEEIIGKTDYDMLPAEEARRIGVIKRRVLETGNTERFVARLPRGDRVYWWETVAAPYHGDDVADGIICLTIDVTERMLVDAARQTAVGVADWAADIVIGMAKDWTIETWSAGAQRILGYDREAATGRPVTFLVGDRAGDDLVRAIERTEKGETIESIELDGLVAASGDRLRLIASFAPIRDAMGAQTGVVCIARPA